MNTFLSSVALIGILFNASSTIPVEKEEEPALIMPATNPKIAGDLITRYERYKSLFSPEESNLEDEDSDTHIVIEKGEAEVTAYSSTPDQTDNDPFIMASGKHVYDGAIATNFLPFGTKVRFPEVYGDKVFTVEDRMNARYNNEHIVDIWFPEKSQAKTFGKRMLTLEIL